MDYGLILYAASSLGAVAMSLFWIIRIHRSELKNARSEATRWKLRYSKEALLNAVEKDSE